MRSRRNLSARRARRRSIRLAGNGEAVAAQRAAFAELGRSAEIDADVWTRLRGAEPAGAIVVSLLAAPSELEQTWTSDCDRRRLSRRDDSRVGRRAASCAASSRRGRCVGVALRAAFAERTVATRIGERLPAGAVAGRRRAPTADRFRGNQAGVRRSQHSQSGHSWENRHERAERRAAGMRAAGQSARARASRPRRVRALRLLSAGMSDVSHARGRERQSARSHRAHARAARGNARARRTRASRRTSADVSAAARARRRVRPAFRTGICSRRRARRSRSIDRFRSSREPFSRCSNGRGRWRWRWPAGA